MEKEQTFSKQAENTVLGAMINHRSTLVENIGRLKKEDFYFLENRIIFEALKGMYNNDQCPSAELLMINLKDNKGLNPAGGNIYVAELSAYAGAVIYIEEFVSIVIEKSRYRNLMALCEQTTLGCRAGKEKPEQLVFKMQESLHNLLGGSNLEMGKTYKEVMEGAYKDPPQTILERIQERKELVEKHGIEKVLQGDVGFGFVDIDKALGGMKNSNFMVLAARPAMGKTAFAMNVAANVVLRQQKGVVVFSLEMSHEQLAQRILSAESEVPNQVIELGLAEVALLGSGLTPSEAYQRVAGTHAKLEKTNLVLDETVHDIGLICSRARMYKESYDPALIIIDYLQLIEGNSGSDNRYEIVSMVSRRLKLLAKELNIPILCLSQLNRKVDERQGHRPVLADLRESGSIEQDADQVFFLKRNHYYDNDADERQADFIIAKNRHGGETDIDLSFRKEFVKFGNYTNTTGVIYDINDHN